HHRRRRAPPPREVLAPQQRLAGAGGRLRRRGAAGPARAGLRVLEKGLGAGAPPAPGPQAAPPAGPGGQARRAPDGAAPGGARCEFLKELGALGTAEGTAEELTKAGAMLQQGLAESLSTTGGTARTFAEVALYGLPLDEPARFTRALQHTGPRQLERLAARAI